MCTPIWNGLGETAGNSNVDLDSGEMVGNSNVDPDSGETAGKSNVDNDAWGNVGNLNFDSDTCSKEIKTLSTGNPNCSKGANSLTRDSA